MRRLVARQSLLDFAACFRGCNQQLRRGVASLIWLLLGPICVSSSVSSAVPRICANLGNPFQLKRNECKRQKQPPWHGASLLGSGVGIDSLILPLLGSAFSAQWRGLVLRLIFVGWLGVKDLCVYLRNCFQFKMYACKSNVISLVMVKVNEVQR